MLSNLVGFPRAVVRPGFAGGLAVVLILLCQPSRAATMIYAATDVADTTLGEDIWEYSYTFAGFTFGAGQGFTVFFDRTLFSQLQSPPPFVNADWDPLTIQPDLILGSNGFYDALALRNAPSLANPFKVKFVWLGTGTPTAQPFVIYNTDFSTNTQGQTTSVPEPSALALLLATVTTFASRRRGKGVLPAADPNPTA